MRVQLSEDKASHVISEMLSCTKKVLGALGLTYSAIETQTGLKHSGFPTIVVLQ